MTAPRSTWRLHQVLSEEVQARSLLTVRWVLSQARLWSHECAPRGYFCTEEARRHGLPSTVLNKSSCTSSLWAITTSPCKDIIPPHPFSVQQKKTQRLNHTIVMLAKSSPSKPLAPLVQESQNQRVKRWGNRAVSHGNSWATLNNSQQQFWQTSQRPAQLISPQRCCPAEPSRAASHSRAPQPSGKRVHQITAMVHRSLPGWAQGKHKVFARPALFSSPFHIMRIISVSQHQRVNRRKNYCGMCSVQG